MVTVRGICMETLEEKALREGKYPLPLEDREKRALEISRLKLSAAGVRKIRLSKKTDSIWVAFKADGVGTKILIAEAMGIYNTVGIDATAMTVNDVLCVGAKPALLVDYIAQNRDDKEKHKKIIEGVEKGCEMANVELVGGETATLGDMIRGFGDGYHFDLATSCMGIGGNSNGPIAGDTIKPGDAIVGLASNGLHSNGYLWVRPLLLKEFNKRAPYSLSDKTPAGNTIGDELLKPSQIYVRPILKMIDELHVRGLAHITGGAYKIKMLRPAPKGISFVLDNMPEPPWIFREIQKIAKCSSERMFEAFNMGVGMTVILPKKEVSQALSIAKEFEIEAQKIGYTRRDDESKVYIPSENIVYKKV